MTDKEFRKLVADMREYQKAYFKAAQGTQIKKFALQKSKEYEALVDKELNNNQNH
jgi:hypothetical protein